MGFEASKIDILCLVTFYTYSKFTALIDYETMDEYDDRGKETQTRMGWLWKANYDYANKYLFEFTARYDGSGSFLLVIVGAFSLQLLWDGNISRRILQDSKLANFFDAKIRMSYGLRRR